MAYIDKINKKNPDISKYMLEHIRIHKKFNELLKETNIKE